MFVLSVNYFLDFPGGSDDKESACNAGDPGSILDLGRFPGEGNGNPLQYSCLQNPMDRGAWWAIVHGVAKIWMRQKKLTHTFKADSFSIKRLFFLEQDIILRDYLIKSLIVHNFTHKIKLYFH